MDVALIVNAGGRSRRMGRDKALLRIPGTDQILVEYIIRRLQQLVTDRLIVVEKNQNIAAHIDPELSVTYTADTEPNVGPLGGLVPALELCRGWAMVVACDMPRVRPSVFELLLSKVKPEHGRKHGARDYEFDAVVPVALGHEQPLLALYHRRCSGMFRTAVSEGMLSVRSSLYTMNVCYVPENELRRADPQLESFLNINTPEEWEDFRRATGQPKCASD